MLILSNPTWRETDVQNKRNPNWVDSGTTLYLIPSVPTGRIRVVSGNDKIGGENLVKDFLGKEIKPGDTIVYPGRHGSSLWMKQAIVEEIIMVPDWRNHPTPTLRVLNPKNKKRTTLTRLDRVTVLKRGRR